MLHRCPSLISIYLRTHFRLPSYDVPYTSLHSSVCINIHATCACTYLSPISLRVLCLQVGLNLLQMRRELRQSCDGSCGESCDQFAMGFAPGSCDGRASCDGSCCNGSCKGICDGNSDGSWRVMPSLIALLCCAVTVTACGLSVPVPVLCCRVVLWRGVVLCRVQRGGAGGGHHHRATVDATHTNTTITTQCTIFGVFVTSVSYAVT